MEETDRDCIVAIFRGDNNVGSLGKTDHSIGFGGMGILSVVGEFFNFGEKFGIGDTIVCAVNLEDKSLACIGFYKNGKWMGTRNLVDVGSSALGVVDSTTRMLQCESALFPRVLLKNVVVQC